ncbi:hypothetical protein Trydic_g13254 [Trypoxylus dichotomus]
MDEMLFLVHKNHRVCHVHFHGEDRASKSYLKKNAVPSLFLPVPTVDGRERIPQPPDIITTRWKTWLESVFYYYEYFDQIKSVIMKMDPSDNAINTSQELFENPQVRNNLYILHNNYISLLNAIKQLQSNSVSLSVSLSLVDSVKEQLQTVMDASGILGSKMLCETLEKSPDYSELCRINQYLKNQNDGFSVDHMYFRYASITCEDVDHSILRHTSAFASQHRSLKETTVETLLMFQVYSDSHPSLCQQ